MPLSSADSQQRFTELAIVDTVKIGAMGQRSSAETVIAIIQSFLRQRVWPQAELARELEIGVPPLRKRLFELNQAGVPLEVQVKHPQVVWSLPREWFPGAIDLKPEEAVETGTAKVIPTLVGVRRCPIDSFSKANKRQPFLSFFCRTINNLLNLPPITLGHRLAP